jgi:hypothetical protein
MTHYFKVWINGHRRFDLESTDRPFRNCRDYHLYLKRTLGPVGVIVHTPSSRWRSKSDA